MPDWKPHDDRLRHLFDAPGISRSFLAQRAMRRGRLKGRDGIFVTVRLTSYRSLPLSCIEDVAISIDGTPIERDELRLIVADVPYRLDELPALSDRWWFVLDMATLFAPLSTLAAGPHDVDATLVTVEPYMTAGRFSMFNPDRRQLAVEEA